VCVCVTWVSARMFGCTIGMPKVSRGLASYACLVYGCTNNCEVVAIEVLVAWLQPRETDCQSESLNGRVMQTQSCSNWHLLILCCQYNNSSIWSLSLFVIQAHPFALQTHTSADHVMWLSYPLHHSKSNLPFCTHQSVKGSHTHTNVSKHM